MVPCEVVHRFANQVDEMEARSSFDRERKAINEKLSGNRSCRDNIDRLRRRHPDCTRIRISDGQRLRSRGQQRCVHRSDQVGLLPFTRLQYDRGVAASPDRATAIRNRYAAQQGNVGLIVVIPASRPGASPRTPRPRSLAS